MTVTLSRAQITTVDNGLTANTSTTVRLGGTLINAATSIDFGSSNTSSSFLLKKGTSSYFLVNNNGTAKFFNSITLGDVYPNAPNEHVINYLGGPYAGRGIKLVNNYDGSIVRMHSYLDGLYLTKDDGSPAGLLLESRVNPSDASVFRATLGRWEINSGIFTINQWWTSSGQLEMTIGDAARKGIIVKSAASQTANLQEWQNSSGTALSVITSSGNIGIGTSTPNSNSKLDVNGNIFSSGKIAIGTTDMTKISTYSLAVNGDALFNKVKVKLYASWPDYVFHKNYNLLPLSEVEKFIQENNHLPEIPSASEVEKEGLDIGDNQALLLKKIEELTLYVIEQNKKIEDQGKRIENLEKELKKK
jgi:hypothetical protein